MPQVSGIEALVNLMEKRMDRFCQGLIEFSGLDFAGQAGAGRIKDRSADGIGHYRQAIKKGDLCGLPACYIVKVGDHNIQRSKGGAIAQPLTDDSCEIGRTVNCQPPDRHPDKSSV